MRWSKTMYPRERFLSVLRGERPDRVPLRLLGFEFRGRKDVESLSDDRQRTIAERIFEDTLGFVHIPSYQNRYLMIPPEYIREVERVERDGSIHILTEIPTPKGVLQARTVRNPISQTLWTVQYPVNNLHDIEKIRSIPWSLPEKLAPVQLETLPDDAGKRLIVVTHVSSPFVCVAGMMPYQYFLECCATERALMEELTALCQERILSLLDVLLSQPGIDVVWMGGCEWLTPPMGSPELYETLVQGPEQAVIARIHEGGALVHVHCHGNTRSTLEWVIERGADYFEPMEPPPDGDISLAEAKQIVAGRIALGGNIEIRLVYYGDGYEVEAAVQAAFEGGKAGMVLQTTAEPISPVDERMFDNYMRMIDLWEAWSPVQ